MNKLNRYLTVKQAAEYMQVHPETIRKWAREGILPSYRRRKIIRFKKEDLDRLLTKKKE